MARGSPGFLGYASAGPLGLRAAIRRSTWRRPSDLQKTRAAPAPCDGGVLERRAPMWRAGFGRGGASWGGARVFVSGCGHQRDGRASRSASCACRWMGHPQALRRPRHRRVRVGVAGQCAAIRDRHAVGPSLRRVGARTAWGTPPSTECHGVGFACTVRVERRRCVRRLGCGDPGPLLVAGDWNVDPRPLAARDADAEARWRLWHAVLDELGLEARCAQSVSGRPPGPQASAAVATSATLCSPREAGHMQVPRELDWVAVSSQVVDRPRAMWGMRFADHACTRRRRSTRSGL